MSKNNKNQHGNEDVQSECPNCGSGMWATWTDLEGETEEDKLCLNCKHRS
jgi:hypothetical protein